MSEKPIWPAVVAGTGAVVAAVTVAGHEVNKYWPAPSQQAKAEAAAFGTGIASGEAQQVLENGTADVEMLDGSHYAHLENPVVTKTGHVIGRDKLTG